VIDSTLSTEKITEVFGKSRQAFYQMEKRRTREMIDTEILLVDVKLLRREQPRLGTRKLYHLLAETQHMNGIKIGRDKFFTMLRDNNMLVKRRRKHVKTTDSVHLYKKYSNLIKGYVPCGPEQIFVSDITYLSVEGGFVYLSLLTDYYSKRIMGYHVHPTLETNGPLEALTMALKNRSHPESKPIHHSDRGIQYCCNEYIQMLEMHSIQISMSAKGNPYENAVAERVNGILKSEYYLDRYFKNIEQVQEVIKETVPIYNEKRPHNSCGNLTPEQAHSRTGILKKLWKNSKPKEKQKDLVPIGELVKQALAQLLRKEPVEPERALTPV
jgi:putative transposase